MSGPKLSCRACETIVQPPMPSLPIERGLPGPGLIAQVLVAKYLRPHPAAPPDRHLCPRGRRARSLDARGLGGTGGVPARPPGRGHRPPRPRRPGAACRRHHRPGAGARARARPGPGGCGWSCATNGHSARRSRRPPSISTRRTARASTPRRCSAPAGASFMPTAMQGSSGSTGPRPRTASRR